MFAIKTNVKKYGKELAKDYVNLPFTDITNQSVEFKDGSMEIVGVKVIGVVVDAVDNGDSFELTISLHQDLAVEYMNGLPSEIVVGKFIKEDN